MASMVMTASSFASGSAMTMAKPTTTTSRRGVMVAAKASAAAASEGEKVSLQMKKNKEESSSGRRDLMMAVAAAAVCSIAKVAMADEPPRGTPEAKKKYAPVCVTMPTARICRK
ncbi:photosystem II 5 kDa protein, chloroplastic [Humulus lupulus]|uniref:photosystem II 5 kDa protein, chloroplastic n=1 Tax=Humulus lupulus TaxID=3486 RepID=UPI002B41487B|nr:photosystem II 5 kDa protein, chloroplastic [Humulus lupulus]